jgi:hypothetical protein
LLTTTWILLIIYTIKNTISSCYCHSRINIHFLYSKRWIYFHTVHLDCIMFSLASIFQSQKYVSECFWNYYLQMKPWNISCGVGLLKKQIYNRLELQLIVAHLTKAIR